MGMHIIEESTHPDKDSTLSGAIAKVSVAPAGIITALANLPADSVLDKSALAAALGRSKKSVQRAVRRGELPAPFKFLGKNAWLASAIVAHFQSRQASALAEAARLTKLRERHLS
jgi:predicted DNA-binding transcriptional regulator AlpA